MKYYPEIPYHSHSGTQDRFKGARPIVTIVRQLYLFFNASNVCSTWNGTSEMLTDNWPHTKYYYRCPTTNQTPYRWNYRRENLWCEGRVRLIRWTTRKAAVKNE